jgi:hypothetical protein
MTSTAKAGTWTALADLGRANFRGVEVANVGNILPDVLSAAQSNIVSTFDLSPIQTLSFVNPSVIGVQVKNASGNVVDTVDLAQAFVLTTTEGPISESLFGAVVLNTIGSPEDRALTETDFLAVDVGSLLTVPNGTPVTILSTLIARFTRGSRALLACTARQCTHRLIVCPPAMGAPARTAGSRLTQALPMCDYMASRDMRCRSPGGFIGSESRYSTLGFQGRATAARGCCASCNLLCTPDMGMSL